MKQPEIITSGRYAALPKIVCMVPERILPATAKLVLQAIIEHLGENSSSWPSYSCLEHETGLSRPTVAKALKLLKRLGFLPAIGKKGCANNYVVEIPNCLMNADAEIVALQAENQKTKQRSSDQLRALTTAVLEKWLSSLTTIVKPLNQQQLSSLTAIVKPLNPNNLKKQPHLTTLLKTPSEDGGLAVPSDQEAQHTHASQPNLPIIEAQPCSQSEAITEGGTPDQEPKVIAPALTKLDELRSKMKKARQRTEQVKSTRAPAKSKSPMPEFLKPKPLTDEDRISREQLMNQQTRLSEDEVDAVLKKKLGTRSRGQINQDIVDLINSSIAIGFTKGDKFQMRQLQMEITNYPYLRAISDSIMKFVFKSWDSKTHTLAWLLDTNNKDGAAGWRRACATIGSRDIWNSLLNESLMTFCSDNGLPLYVGRSIYDLLTKQSTMTWNRGELEWSLMQRARYMGDLAVKGEEMKYQDCRVLGEIDEEAGMVSIKFAPAGETYRVSWSCLEDPTKPPQADDADAALRDLLATAA